MSLPFLAKKPIDLPPIVSVELIQITDKTNIPFAPKAKKTIEKIKEKEKKLVSEQAPPKKVKKIKPDSVPMPEDKVKKVEKIKEDKQNPEKIDNEVKQVSEFEKKELFDPNNIAALIDKSKVETAETNKKTDKVTQDQQKNLESTGLSLRYAYRTQRGYYPDDMTKNNQDAFKVMKKLNGNSNLAYFGVFDGHGKVGDKCSYYVRDNIEQKLKMYIGTSRITDPKFDEKFSKCYTSINQEMHKPSVCGFDDLQSGTTAVSVYLEGLKLKVSNIGDSRCIAAFNNGDDFWW